MSSVDIKLDGLNVMVGIPAGRDFHAHTVRSLVGTFDLCARLNVKAELGMIAGSSVVQWARDEVIDLFLNSKCNRLFWIDSDMSWMPSDFIRVLAFTKLRPVVGVAYPAKMDTLTFFVSHEEGKPLEQGDYGLVEVKGVGLGFTCMTREVVEAVVAEKPKIFDEVARREMAEVFRVGSVAARGRRCRMGEDMAFFEDIRNAGFKVHLDPAIQLGHIGQKEYVGALKQLFEQTDTGEANGKA